VGVGVNPDLRLLVPYRMAERRKRDGYLWVAISLIGSPFLAILLLLIAGWKQVWFWRRRTTLLVQP
jgi:hypothetical protein